MRCDAISIDVDVFVVITKAKIVKEPFAILKILIKTIRIRAKITFLRLFDVFISLKQVTWKEI